MAIESHARRRRPATPASSPACPLSEAERAALANNPYLERMFLGQAVHRATFDIIRSAGYRYSSNLGPDFVTTIGGAKLYIELTTPLQVAAHMARGGLYSIAKIITYVLP